MCRESKEQEKQKLGIKGKIALSVAILFFLIRIDLVTASPDSTPRPSWIPHLFGQLYSPFVPERIRAASSLAILEPPEALLDHSAVLKNCMQPQRGDPLVRYYCAVALLRSGDGDPNAVRLATSLIEHVLYDDRLVVEQLERLSVREHAQAFATTFSGRQLAELLESIAPENYGARHWGPLRRVRMGDNTYRWMCDDHARRIGR